MEGEKFIRKLLESFKKEPPMFLRSTEGEKRETRNLVEELEGVFKKEEDNARNSRDFLLEQIFKLPDKDPAFP